MINATYLNKNSRWDDIQIAPQHIMLVEEVKDHPNGAQCQVTLDDTNALSVREPMIDVIAQMAGIPRMWVEAKTNTNTYMAAIVLSFISFIAPLGPDDEDSKGHVAIILQHGLPIVTKGKREDVLKILNTPIDRGIADYHLDFPL